MQSFDERKASRLWHPHGLLGQISKMELEQVAAVFEHAYFLIVRLDEFSSGLGAGLKAAEVNQVQPRAWSETSTVSVGPDFITKLTSQRASVAPPPPEQSGAQPDYPADLLSAECHVVRIRKRTWQTTAPTITVGRAAEQDIPLQHPSVSKLHALFDLDAGNLYVTDVGSLNHTFVRGEVISGRTRVRPGDAVKFGAVRCAVCSAQGLWRAVKAQGEPQP